MDDPNIIQMHLQFETEFVILKTPHFHTAYAANMVVGIGDTHTM